MQEEFKKLTSTQPADYKIDELKAKAISGVDHGPLSNQPNQAPKADPNQQPQQRQSTYKSRAVDPGTKGTGTTATKVKSSGQGC